MKHRRHRGILKAAILAGDKRIKNPFYRLMELCYGISAERLMGGKLFYTCKRRLRKNGK